MITRLITFSLKNRYLTIVLSAVLIGVGYYCFTQLKIEAYPDIADTNVIVVAQYPGRAAEEVEQQVSVPIERALQNTPNVLDRRSRTIFGLSVVQLTFKDGTDDYFARQQVLERLSSAELPEGVTPELAPLSTAVGEVLRYVVEAPPIFSPMQLRDMQDWIIKPYLLQTPGIADIVTFGGPLKQFHILIDPGKLTKYGLTNKDVEDAVIKNNQNTGGNILNRGEQGFAVRGMGAIRGEHDIENIVLESVRGVPIYIKDVASVEIAPPPPNGVLGYTVTDAKEGRDVDQGIEGIVLLRRYENPSEVLEQLFTRLKELTERELPEGVKITPLYDRSFLIDHSLHTVGKTLVEGVAIVIIILVFFLGSLRSALVVALTIIFSLCFSFILMRLTGIPANLLSLGAIDFGIIVDGACVMVVHLIGRYKRASEQERMKGIIPLTTHVANEVSREVFFSVTIIILAYMPILLMTRVEGKLFTPMALTLSFAVFGSLIAALTLIPVLVSFSYEKVFKKVGVSMKVYKNFILTATDKVYHKLLAFLFKYYKKTIVIGFALILVLLGFGLKLGSEFLPELDEGSIFLRANFPAGITIQVNAKQAPKIREIIASYPQVAFVITQTGRNDDGTDPFPSDRNEILIGLKDYGLWADTISKRELIQSMRTRLEGTFPSVKFTTGQPIIDQVMEIVTGTAADLAISIVGDNLMLMREKADSIVKIVERVQGASGVNIEQEGTQEQLSIEINREKIARYGMNISDIQNIIEAAIGGKAISVVYDGIRKYDIVVRYLEQFRQNFEKIKNILVPTSKGSLIPMEELAEIRFAEGQTNIYHYNGKRMITVRTNIEGRDQGGFVAELQQRIQQEVSIPKGYEIHYGGQYENLERAGKGLLFTIPLTLILVFAFLYILYHDLKNTLITASCILFALAGGIIALLLRGYYFNVSAGIGFVSIFGISVMAGVVLVSALNREVKSKGLTIDVVECMSVEQLRALLSILLLAILGLLPAATSSGIGSDVQRPLATVIIGGLTATLIFTPLLLPPIYYWAHRKDKK